MKESTFFNVPIDQIKYEVIDSYELGTPSLVEAISTDVQNFSDLLRDTTWWKSFSNPNDRQEEITDMAWEIENLWLEPDDYYETYEGFLTMKGININERG